MPTFAEICKMDSKQLMELIKKRAWGPVGSVIIHIFAVIILLNVAMGGGEVAAPPVEAVVMETKAVELEPPEVKHEQQPEPITEPVEVPEHEIRNTAEYSATEEISDIPDPGRGRGLGTGTGTGVGDGDQAGLQISGAKSPLIMKGLYGSRGSGGRGRALSKYGGGGMTEGAVMRALRWLKKTQNADGSWDGPPVPMTAWALLCYLAHGETPASEEFGATVEKAIKYLASGQWPASYSWPIATYAMCEAYGMTKVPMLRDVAYKGVDGVIKAQNAQGGWGYGVPTTQDTYSDTSVMGWCAQALKAAKLAGIDHPELDNAIKHSIMGFKANAGQSGGFGYRSGNPVTGLTGVGVLCMQLLGAAREQECQSGLSWLDTATFKWDDAWLAAPIYYWYYVTQAKFHAGGERWTAWNKQFAPELVKNQIVIKGGGVDGKDIGYWELPKKGGAAVAGHSTGLTFNTTLCCLMLEVYYRYLPTYKQPEEDNAAAAPAAGAAVGADVNIEMK